MRIAYDHQIFTQQRFGGISRYFAELVPRLDDLGETPKVFAGVHKNEYLRRLKPDLIQGGFMPGLAGRLHRLRFMANEKFARLRIARWKPDLIHETYFRSRISPPGGIPTVFTVYDMIHELFPSEFANHAAESNAKRWSVEMADHVICISHSTRNDLIRLMSVDPAKVSVVHLGIELAGDRLPMSDRKERPYFLFVGHRGGYKNFQGMLEAFSLSEQSKDFDLVAFGGSPFSAIEMERMHSLAIKPDRIRHAAGSDEVLAGLYRDAHALIYPSIYEGFGLPPLEAMAQGCPVISSSTSSMPEVIGDAAEFFDPTDKVDMAKAMSLLATSDSRRSELIAKGRKRIRQFSWDKTAIATREIYRNILR